MIQGGNHAIRWDDLRFPANDLKVDSTNPPTATSYKGGSVLAFSSTRNEKIYFIAQMPHERAYNTEIEMHVHYTLKTAGAGLGTENVKWILTYSWANINDAFPAETTVNDTKDVGMYQIADTHILQDIVQIDGTGKTLSSVIIGSLERDVSVADDYTDEVYLLEFDIHYQIDSNGSREEIVK